MGNRGGTTLVVGDLSETVIRAECGLYKLRRMIGRGAMASVYLAENELTRERVAIKVLDNEICSDFPNIEKRCERGAKALIPIVHPNIVRVYETGRYRGLRYVVMEYIHGRDLDSQLRGTGALPWERVARIGLQLCHGLAAAHRHGLIHRDVKPANCMLEEGTELVKVADFGIARESRLSLGAGITALDKLVGTPAYIAPEVVQISRPTPQMDIYSLGVTLYKLLSDTLPFVAATPKELLEAKRHGTPQRPSKLLGGLPTPLEPIIMKALSRFPDERYQSMASMAEAIRVILPAGAVIHEQPAAKDDVATATYRPRSARSPSQPKGKVRIQEPGLQLKSEPKVSREYESTTEDSEEHSILPKAVAPSSFPWFRLSMHVLAVGVVLAFFGLSSQLLHGAVARRLNNADTPEASSVAERQVSWEQSQKPAQVKVGRAPKHHKPAETSKDANVAPPQLAAVETAKDVVEPPEPAVPSETGEQLVEQVDPVAAKPPETQPVPADPKTLRQREVRSRLKEYRNAVIKACYVKDMTATLQGMVPNAWTVSVRVTVSPSGTVAKVRVSGAKKAALKTCIEEQLRRRAFPSGSGQSSAKLRFTFSPK